MKRALAQKKINLYAIDASTLADSVGLGRRVNTVMQAVFFKLSGVLPVEQAISLLKDAVTKTYKLKGAKIVDMNILAIDEAIKQVRAVAVPAAWADAVDEPVVSAAPPVPAFIEEVVRRSFKLEGD
jgi:pyruvate-ferredoxin/flavodoxin oxidoreductase